MRFPASHLAFPLRVLSRCLLGGLVLAAAFAMAVPGTSVRETTPAAAAGAINPLTAAEVVAASATIDQFVNARLERMGVTAPGPASDAELLRRAYLSILGRIPTADEALAFLGSTASAKRSMLIDRLMQNEARVHREFTWWADLLRVQTQMNNRPGIAFIDWLKERIRNNVPYDSMVRQMLTAEGAALADGNGATGFWLRDAGMPLDRMANVSQVFLGTQIGCAQCHDHPFDAWKRRQFFEFAAYLHGSDARRDLPGGRETKQLIKQQEDSLTPEERKVLRRIGDSVGLRVNSTVRSNIELPEDYQYADAKPKDKVEAAVIFGPAIPLAKGQDPRVAFAAWMTSAENPRFALVIANRMWKRAFGIGLIEPIDDLRDDTVASDPALMDFLTRLMVSVTYDLRAFQTILYQTTAWQRQADRSEFDPDATPTFASPRVTRLGAEQLWDSLMTLAVADIDRKKGEDATALHVFYNEHKSVEGEQLLELVRTTARALEMGQAIRQQLQKERGSLPGARGKELEDIRKRIAQLNTQRDSLAERFEPVRYKGKGGGNDWLRAAELLQPVAPGHFLRVFGQSDREFIENATSSPAVTQALFLMNGPFENALFKDGSPLRSTLAKATDEASRVRACYLSILSRSPDLDELKLGTAYLVRYGDEGLHDLVWSLVNANEFLFLP